MLKYTIEEFAELLGTKPAKPNSPIYHEPPIVILGIKKSDPVQTKQLVFPNQNNMTIKGTAEGLFNDDGEFVKGTFTYEEGMVDEGEFNRFGFQKGKRTFPDGDYAYGDFVDGTKEDSNTKPTNIYGEAKLTGERLTKLFAKRDGLNYIIVRPSGVYGPGDLPDRVVSKFFAKAMKNETITLHNLSLIHI